MTAIPKTLAIDFDNTICEMKYPEIGPPKPGVKEALTKLREAGYRISIWSCRTCKWYPEVYNPDNEPLDMNRRVVREMHDWLNLHEIPYDDIDDGTMGKPFADYYIDDKAIRFENNWKEIAERITGESCG